MPNRLEVKNVKLKNILKDCKCFSLPRFYFICLEDQKDFVYLLSNEVIKILKMFLISPKYDTREHFSDNAM